MKVAKCPSAPSKEEIEKHMMTCVPLRSWCPHCVAGQSGRKGYFKRENTEEKEVQVPAVHIDYMYLKSEEEESKDEKMKKRQKRNHECQF